ncbi:MAG: hypothetical protein JRE58_13500, partial [Deltaproteobacteria bacterium]|nr:hypothetical protein [Deltaproteobacteria bacterium]
MLSDGPPIVLPVGGKPPCPELPVAKPAALQMVSSDSQRPAPKADPDPIISTGAGIPAGQIAEKPADDPLSDTKLIQGMTKSMEATAEAHRTFLDFSRQTSRAFADTFELQNQLLE